MSAGARTRVVLVEDSPTQAHVIARMLEADGDLSVVATAGTATDAIAQVARLRPDLAVMDLDLPEGGGRLAIDRIMSEAPTPILVLSGTFEQAGAPEAVAALAAGAVEAVPKPGVWTPEDGAALRRLARRVGGVPVIGRRTRPARATRRPGGAGAGAGPTVAGAGATGAILGIAASTGGPAAVAAVLAGLRDCRVPILVVQHINPSFTDSFTRWLAGASGLPVRLAADGQRLQPGTVHVAPGDRHLGVGPARRVVLDREPEALHRPSADVLFESLAREEGARAVGVVLTGMGADGANGLRRLRAAGGTVLAQDEATSVVFGMPQAAHRSGAVDAFTALDDLPRAIRAAIQAVPR